MFTAWNTARLTTFNGGKLRSLADELKQLRKSPPKKQTPEQIISALRAIRATLG